MNQVLDVVLILGTTSGRTESPRDGICIGYLLLNLALIHGSEVGRRRRGANNKVQCSLRQDSLRICTAHHSVVTVTCE